MSMTKQEEAEAALIAAVKDHRTIAVYRCGPERHAYEDTAAEYVVVQNYDAGIEADRALKSWARAHTDYAVHLRCRPIEEIGGVRLWPPAGVEPKGSPEHEALIEYFDQRLEGLTSDEAEIIVVDRHQPETPTFSSTGVVQYQPIEPKEEPS